MSRSLEYMRHVDVPEFLPRRERETFIPDNCHNGRSGRLDLAESIIDGAEGVVAYLNGANG